MSIEKIEQIEAHVKQRLEALFAEIGAENAPVVLQRPPKPEMGDLAVPCFPLAKSLRKAPPQIAASLAEKLTPDDVISEAEAQGGFLNIRFDPAMVAGVTIGQVFEETGEGAKGFGSDSTPEKRRYLVEYSSPNTNKPLHLGHVRNNAIGLSVCKILEHVGHDVTAVCLVNDRGVHICQTLLAYRHWGEGRNPEDLKIKGDHYVGSLYVQFGLRFDREYEAWLESDEGQARFRAWQEARAAKKQKAPKKKEKEGDIDLRKVFKSAFSDEYFNTVSALGGEARELLRQWEAGDEEVRTLWQKMNQWVYDGFDATYRRMGVSFDKMYYESETYKLGREVVEDGLSKDLFHRLDDGAVVCDYERLDIKGGQTPHKFFILSE